MARVGSMVITCFAIGCGGAARIEPPPAPAVVTEPTCADLHVPIRFRFPCLSACFEPELADNEEELDRLVEMLRQRPGLRQIRLVGYLSLLGSAERDPRYIDLGERRARSVAAELVRRGFDPSIIVTEAAAWQLEALRKKNEPDRCLSPAEERYPHPDRRVEVNIIDCFPP